MQHDEQAERRRDEPNQGPPHPASQATTRRGRHILRLLVDHLPILIRPLVGSYNHWMNRRSFLFLSLTVALAAPVAGQFDTSSWNRPYPPFTVAGPVHYVGTSELAAYLITTPSGHVLIDGGLPESAPLIERSIRDLGFKWFSGVVPP